MRAAKRWLKTQASPYALEGAIPLGYNRYSSKPTVDRLKATALVAEATPGRRLTVVFSFLKPCRALEIGVFNRIGEQGKQAGRESVQGTVTPSFEAPP